MDMKRWATLSRRKRTFEDEDRLVVDAMHPAHPEDFSRVPILQFQEAVPRVSVDGHMQPPSTGFDTRAKIDTVSTRCTTMNTPILDTMSSLKTRRRIFEAAWNLIVVRGEAGFTMAHIAKRARISRQALYLHFADRAALLDALVEYVDEKRGLVEEIQRILAAPTGLEAVQRMASLQATQNPGIWAIALAFEAVRRIDKAAQRSWQNRQTKRLNMCRTCWSGAGRRPCIRNASPGF